MAEEAEKSFLIILIQKQDVQCLELRKQLKVRAKRKRNRPARFLALFKAIDAVEGNGNVSLLFLALRIGEEQDDLSSALGPQNA